MEEGVLALSEYAALHEKKNGAIYLNERQYFE